MAFLLNPYVFSSLYSFTASATSSDSDADAVCQVIATLNTNGTVTVTNNDAGDDLVSDFNYWHNAGAPVTNIGNSRWAKKTLLNGSDITSGTLGTTITSLNTARTITIELVAGNPEESRIGEVLIEVYSDSGGTNKVGEIYLTLTAQSAGQGAYD
jgi:hypothetical protein